MFWLLCIKHLFIYFAGGDKSEFHLRFCNCIRIFYTVSTGIICIRRFFPGISLFQAVFFFVIPMKIIFLIGIPVYRYERYTAWIPNCNCRMLWIIIIKFKSWSIMFLRSLLKISFQSQWVFFFLTRCTL